MKAKWLEKGGFVSAQELGQEGVFYEYFEPNPATFQQGLDAWKAKRGYVAQDEVKLSPQTPNLDAILAKFSDEHLHTDDEVRYIVSGEGIFDVRSRADQWIRILVEAGDFIIVPANMYHRFTLTETKTIHAVRLFKENPSWVPVYRGVAVTPPPPGPLPMVV